jgi:hypothetical protein
VFLFRFFIFFATSFKQTGSVSLPVLNHLMFGPTAKYLHQSLSDSRCLGYVILYFGTRFGKADFFCEFPSEVDMGVTREMLERLGLNRDPKKNALDSFRNARHACNGPT